MNPQVSSSLIAAGGSLAGGVLQNVLNRSYNEKWNEQNQKNFERSLEFNAQEAEKARQFNSVQSLVNQYKAAGLNPNLLAGSLGGSSATADAGGLPESNAFYGENALGDAASLAVSSYRMFMDAQNQQALTDANVNKLNAEARLADAQATESGFRDRNFYDSQIRERLAAAGVSDELVKKIEQETGLTAQNIDTSRAQAQYFRSMAHDAKSRAALNYIDARVREQMNEWFVKSLRSQVALNRQLESYYNHAKFAVSMQKLVSYGEFELIKRNAYLFDETASSLIKEANYRWEQQYGFYIGTDGKKHEFWLRPIDLELRYKYLQTQSQIYGIDLLRSSTKRTDAETNLINTRIENYDREVRIEEKKANAALLDASFGRMVGMFHFGFNRALKTTMGSFAPGPGFGMNHDANGYYDRDGNFQPYMYKFSH